mgnify:CR=1 FL=1
MNFGDNILIICTYQELADQYRKILKEKHLNIDIEVMDNRFGKDMPKIFEYMAQFQNKKRDHHYARILCTTDSRTPAV